MTRAPTLVTETNAFPLVTEPNAFPFVTETDTFFYGVYTKLYTRHYVVGPAKNAVIVARDDLRDMKA